MRTRVTPFLLFAGILFAGFANSALAQANLPPEVRKRMQVLEVNRLSEAAPKPEKVQVDPLWKFAQYIDTVRLRGHLEFLASDELEGRETAARGQKIAARYIASHFRKIGLQPVVDGPDGKGWFQSFNLMKSQVREVSISFDGKETLKPLEDFGFFSKTSLVKDLDLDLVFAGHGIEDERYNNLKGLDLEGKAALIFPAEPTKDGKSVVTGTEKYSEWSDGFYKVVQALEKRGAKAVLVMLPEDNFKKFTNSPWLSYTLKQASLKLETRDDASIPLLFIPESRANKLMKKSKVTASKLKKQLEESATPAKINFKNNRLTMDSDADHKVVTSENVLGFLEGTDKKDEIVVITGHYDHLGVRGEKIFNGADDDGSGTSGVLALAEAFAEAAKNGHRPRRSMLFMTVSGEEKGLLGSEYYTKNPIFPLENTVTDLNIDMIGRVDDKHAEEGVEEYVYIIGSDKLSSELHEINERMNKEYTKLTFDYTYNSPDDPNRFYYRSDHYNFASKGIPVIFFFTGVHKDYHKETDTVEKIRFGKMAKILQLVFADAWEIANREGKLVVDKESDFE